MRTPMIALITFMVVTGGCHIPEKKKAPLSKPVQVRVEPVNVLEYKVPVRATGRLSTTTEMKLSFKTGGIVKVLNVREGQTVKRGEVLAILNLSEIKAQTRQAHIGLEKAERDLKRAGNLYRDSVVTLEQYQNVESAIQLARAQKQIADFNLEHSQITAPSDGQILKLLVEENEVIAPGYPAILFASLESDWVIRVALTDKDIVRLKLGDTAQITMDAFPGSKLKSLVTELGTGADPVTGTYEAELSIVHSLRQFRTGFIARADIYPRQVNLATAIPIISLLDANDNTADVYVYEKGKVEKRRIRTGLILKDQIIVTEGLTEGELVITEGAKYIRKDTDVNPVNYSESNLQ